MQFNIYFGLINENKPVEYKYTENYKSEKEALEDAKTQAIALFSTEAGKFGLPSFLDIQKESKDLNIPVKVLWEDHIWDMTRYYAIPTELDTIPSKKLKKRRYK